MNLNVLEYDKDQEGLFIMVVVRKKLTGGGKLVSHMGTASVWVDEHSRGGW